MPHKVIEKDIRKMKHYKRVRELTIPVLMAVLIAAIIAWRNWGWIKQLAPAISGAFYAAIVAALMLALPLGYLLPHSRVSRVLDIIGNHWLCLQLVFIFVAAIEWAGDLLLVYILGALSANQYAYISFALFSISFMVVIYGIINALVIRNTSYECKLSKQGFGDCKIVQLSDMHLSCINDLNMVKKIVAEVNAMEPDLVCITGDTFTDAVRDVFDMDEIAAALRKLRSKHGVYACLGNHDYGGDQSRMLAFYEAADVRVLIDNYIELDGITLIGRTDMTPGGDMKYKRKSIEDCMAGIDHGNAIIVMDHQPGDIEHTAAAGCDVLLSGHTHGGQFFPVTKLVQKAFPHYYGCKRFGNLYSIVSSGSGAAIPTIRIGSRSEIVEVVVSSAGN